MALFLVVEEDQDSRALAERVLAAQGHTVAAFGDAQEASAWLQGNGPDLALVSAGNHGENARRRLDALRAAGVDGRRIVLTTGLGAVSHVREAVGGGVREVLPKPAGIEELETLVRSLFPQGRRTAAGPEKGQS